MTEYLELTSEGTLNKLEMTSVWDVGTGFGIIDRMAICESKDSLNGLQKELHLCAIF